MQFLENIISQIQHSWNVESDNCAIICQAGLKPKQKIFKIIGRDIPESQTIHTEFTTTYALYTFITIIGLK